MSRHPRIWALLGEKVGDNNQLLALAEGLGLPFETRPMRYNLGRAVPPRYLGATLRTLTGASRRWLEQPWPDLVLAIGRRSVPVARWLQKASGGRSRLVLVGHPRVDPEHFDLVLTTHQYPVPRKGNVTVLPLAMSRLRDPGTPTQSERAWLEELPRPRLLLALGGPTKYWDLDPEQIAGHTRKLVERARRQRGTVIAVSSRRTPPPVVEAVRAQLGTDDRIVDGVGPRFSLLMSDADEIFVTADSVSMLSEAIQTSKPVGMVPISLSSKGRRMIGKDGGSPSGRRDLRRIWEALAENGLVGTVEEPAAGDGQIVALDLAVAAVRRALQEQAA
jgi:mitochondrial fission protein ELM1